jgi:RNA polymerase sigma-70 factor (ECF subfamily)
MTNAAAITIPWSARQDKRLVASLTDRFRRRSKPGHTSGPADEKLVSGLMDGDEDAFATLVDRYGPMMLRVASLYVRDRAVAEEVVQETWLAVLQGIDRFEGRSSLKTWIFRILTNRAKTRGAREARVLPFSAFAADAERDEPAVDPDRFLGPDSQTPQAWATPPRGWPEERLLAAETRAVVADAIEHLPESQREVIRLRDVEGWKPDEVTEALEISDGNQRVLLHRARSKVRAALEDYFEGGVGR